MWAYYGNNHQGYCLEFSTTEPHQTNELTFNNINEIYKVIYSDKHYNLYHVHPFFSSANQSQTDFNESRKSNALIFAHKSKAWEHEQEWRLIKNIYDEKIYQCTTKGALYPFPGKLISVYFGVRMSDDDKKKIKDAIANGNYGYTTNFYDMKIKKDSFGLEI